MVAKNKERSPIPRRTRGNGGIVAQPGRRRVRRDVDNVLDLTDSDIMARTTTQIDDLDFQADQETSDENTAQQLRERANVLRMRLKRLKTTREKDLREGL